MLSAVGVQSQLGGRGDSPASAPEGETPAAHFAGCCRVAGGGCGPIAVPDNRADLDRPTRRDLARGRVFRVACAQLEQTPDARGATSARRRQMGRDYRDEVFAQRVRIATSQILKGSTYR